MSSESTKRPKRTQATTPAKRKRTKAPRTRRTYTPTEIDAGLLALVYLGNAEKAAEATGYPATTLKTWRQEKEDRYRELAEREGPKLEALMVEQARRSVIKAGELEDELLDALRERKHELKAADLAGAARNISTSKAINVDKLLVLTNRPRDIVEHRNVDSIFAELRSRFPGSIVDGTAQDITPSLALPSGSVETNEGD